MTWAGWDWKRWEYTGLHKKMYAMSLVEELGFRASLGSRDPG